MRLRRRRCESRGGTPFSDLERPFAASPRLTACTWQVAFPCGGEIARWWKQKLAKSSESSLLGSPRTGGLSNFGVYDANNSKETTGRHDRDLDACHSQNSCFAVGFLAGVFSTNRSISSDFPRNTSNPQCPCRSALASQLLHQDDLDADWLAAWHQYVLNSSKPVSLIRG